jgi:hypothetical protein
MVSKLSEIGFRVFIPDPYPNFLPIPDLDPGSRGQKGTESRIRIRKTVRKVFWVKVQKFFDADPDPDSGWKKF